MLYNTVTGWDTDSLPGSCSRPLAKIRGEKAKGKGNLVYSSACRRKRTRLELVP
jgi:hypothetical protein